MYAISAAAPVVLIAYMGDFIQRQVPHVLSLTDFVGWRFGLAAKTYVIGMICFNMSIAMLAEYTTIGELFGSYLGTQSFPIIIVVGCLTMCYTAYGGLLVSIITDRLQGAASAALMSLLVVYVAATFRYPLPTPPPCDPDDPQGICVSGANLTGYSSIFTMPVSLFVSTCFSEAMWQRVWASDTKNNLRWGSWIAFLAIFCVVFFTGLCGLLAAWAGLITPDVDSNLYLFLALKGSMNSLGQIANWVGVVTIIFTVIMNESAIDSMQNGLTAALSSHFLKDYPLVYTRLAVVGINIPIMVVATRGYTILQLFLLGNMLCSTSSFPVLVGLSETLHPYYGGGGMLIACALSFAMVSIYGVSDQWNDALSSSQNISQGMNYTWLGNFYSWQYFLIPVCVSIGSVMLTSALNYLWIHYAAKKPIALPGFVSCATHPHLKPSSVLKTSPVLPKDFSQGSYNIELSQDKEVLDADEAARDVAAQVNACTQVTTSTSASVARKSAQR